MFSKLIFFVGAVAVCAADMHMNETDYGTNYFVDSFEDGSAYYPYPLGLCLETGLTTTEYAIYRCNPEGTRVKKTIYSNSDCSTESSSEWFDETTITDEGIYDFECNGINSYSEVFLCVGDDQCQSCTLGYSATVYAAMDLCAYSGSNATIMTSCDDDSTSLIVYPESDMCMEVEGVNTTDLIASTECTYFYSVEAFGIPLDIYAQSKACVVDVSLAPTGSPSDMPTSVPTAPTAAPVEASEESGDDDDDDSAISVQSISSFAIAIMACLIALR